MSILEKVDPEMAAILVAEKRRQAQTLEMIASENHVSAAVLEATASVLTDKYAEGYPHKRWYCGCENADAVEQLAIDRAKQLFGAEHVNVQPHSGTSANLAVYLAAIKPGQKIMGMRLDQGGHLSHGMETNLSGICYKVANYGLRKDTEMLDMDQIRRQALSERPDILVVGASAYPRVIDFKAFGAIADEVGCPMLSDIAHIAGLVVGKAHPDPVPYSAFVTTTTHKTLRGPRGGVVLCRKEYAKAIDHAIFPGIQGGPLVHVIAAKAVCFQEALHDDFRKYAANIIGNARALASTLQSKGWRLVSGGTDNHLMLVDLTATGLTGMQVEKALDSAGIVCNHNAIPFDTRPPRVTSGIRLGTPGVTSRGMGKEEMKTIAGLIMKVINNIEDKKVTEEVRQQIGQLCRRFPVPGVAD